MSPLRCPFCALPRARILSENDHALWIRDGFPVSPGHSLVIPKRHTGSFFDTSDAERHALLALLDEAKAAATTEFAPAGFNMPGSRAALLSPRPLRTVRESLPSYGSSLCCLVPSALVMCVMTPSVHKHAVPSLFSTAGTSEYPVVFVDRVARPERHSTESASVALHS